MKPMIVVIKIGGSLIREAPELVNRLINEFGSGSQGTAPDIKHPEKKHPSPYL